MACMCTCKGTVAYDSMYVYDPTRTTRPKAIQTYRHFDQ